MNKKKLEKVISEYQCSGCVGTNFKTCYKQQTDTLSCDNHVAGTLVQPHVGRVFLGLPKGFNRLGACDQTRIYIFEKLADDGWFIDGYLPYSKFNIPVWKYLDENGHTLIRVFSPRLNYPSIHIILEDCREQLNCIEITDADIATMD